MSYYLLSICTDDMGIIYILISQINYPQRTAHMCLEQLQRGVLFNYYDVYYILLIDLPKSSSRK